MVVDIAKVLELLKVAKCPACDGSGMISNGPSEDDGWYWIECQWCSERKEVLNGSG